MKTNNKESNSSNKFKVFVFLAYFILSFGVFVYFCQNGNFVGVAVTLAQLLVGSLVGGIMIEKKAPKNKKKNYEYQNENINCAVSNCVTQPNTVKNKRISSKVFWLCFIVLLIVPLLVYVVSTFNPGFKEVLEELWIYFWGFLFYCFGVYWIVNYVREKIYVKNYITYEVNAHVESVKERRGYKGRRTHAPVFSYEYEGKEYVVQSNFISTFWCTKKLKEGMNVTIKINPDSPEEISYGRVDVEDLIYGILIILLPFIYLIYV